MLLAPPITQAPRKLPHALWLVPLLVLGALALTAATVRAADQTIVSAGPLDEIIISDELNCQVAHTADTVYEFYNPGVRLGACGTFIVYAGTLYGPSSVPAGGSAAPLTPYTLVSQSAVTGAGSLADPFRIVTVVTAGGGAITITETDSYVVGQESYRTDIQVASTVDTSVVLYRAGDCYLQGSDEGFGSVNVATGAVACVAPVIPDDESSGPGSRIEEWFPLSPGSSYYQAFFDDVWAQIGAQAVFPNTCECATFQDNGAGLSWTLNLAAGGSATVSHMTTFAPLGIAALVATKTADAATSAPGATNGYTITISNPNNASITLSSITDTLPAGFGYNVGSSTGATTADPAISGQSLTWSVSTTVPANGSVTLHFNVTVATAPGTYTNDAGGTATGTAVTSSGATAPITVTGTATTAPTATPTPALLPNTTSSPAAGASGPAAVLAVSLLLGASLATLVVANARSWRLRRR
jgi:uncharacterized repeat protein (TIGR01451 family)